MNALTTTGQASIRANKQSLMRLHITTYWIDKNADWLPGGFTLEMFGSARNAELHYYPTYMTAPIAETLTVLTDLLGEPDRVRTAVWSGAIWPAEGDRPAITIHGHEAGAAA